MKFCNQEWRALHIAQFKWRSGPRERRRRRTRSVGTSREPKTRAASPPDSHLHARLPASSLRTSSLVTTPRPVGQWARESGYFCYRLNAAPRAPYQHYNRNSWEQLNMGFNSSLTTEVKIIARGSQMEVASKELFTYRKVLASPTAIPQLILRGCRTFGTHDKHIYPASRTGPMCNSKSLSACLLLLFSCRNWQLNKYVSSERLLLSYVEDPLQNRQLYVLLQEHVSFRLRGN